MALDCTLGSLGTPPACAARRGHGAQGQERRGRLWALSSPHALCWLLRTLALGLGA